MERNFFTNTAGKKFPIVGLSPMEIERINVATREKFVKAGKRLTAPTYTASTVDGTVQTFEHNANTVETEEDKQALAEYQAVQLELQTETNTKLSRAAMICVDVDPMVYPRWVGRMKLMEVPIPADEFERMLLFVETEVLKSVEDIAGLIVAALYSGGAVDEAGVDAAEAAFRGSLSELYRKPTDSAGAA